MQASGEFARLPNAWLLVEEPGHHTTQTQTSLTQMQAAESANAGIVVVPAVTANAVSANTLFKQLLTTFPLHHRNIRDIPYNSPSLTIF